jgi:hypothetical protein
MSYRFQEAPRRFYLDRHVDDTGVSGTGIVAMGVQFECGKVIMCWSSEGSPIHSVSIWDGIDQVRRVHGHNGRTSIVWVDTCRKLVSLERD